MTVENGNGTQRALGAHEEAINTLKDDMKNVRSDVSKMSETLTIIANNVETIMGRSRANESSFRRIGERLAFYLLAGAMGAIGSLIYQSYNG